MRTQLLYQNGLIILFTLIAAVIQAQPEITVNRDVLDFGAFPEGQTGSQTLFIDNAGDGTLNWTASSSEDWLTVQPSSGTGSGQVTVSVNPGTMPPDFYYSPVHVTNVDDPNDQTHVSGVLNVYDPGSTMGPFGSFDTPMNGATLSSSVAVTGWVLDDIEVEEVAIYKDDGVNFDYLGDATFIEGARPDVETLYPGYPKNYQAGWGYMMLTNFLPDGNYTLYAYVHDKEGNFVNLGTKTITVDNANAVKPFGAIDTPTQGGVASGSRYKVSGWALTPQPNHIPSDGSTIDVYVDGENVGHPTYNVYRQDVADLFPGYSNSQAAGGYFFLDTTPYSNGVHTIQWTARDSDDNTDGIGSRYFTIQNPDMPTPVTDKKRLHFGAEPSSVQTTTQSVRMSNIGQGTLNWNAVPSADWVTVDPSSGVNSGYVDVSVNPTGLDPGYYQTTIHVSGSGAGQTTVTVGLSNSDGSKEFPPFGTFNTPLDGSTVSGTIPVTGWALDEVGVQSVLVNNYIPYQYGYPEHVGDATFVEGSRPDLQQTYPSTPMNYKGGWGYMLQTNLLPEGGNGTYILEAVATNYSGQQTSLGTRTIIVDNENAVKPFGAIDSPGWGEPIAGHQARISGWALTPQPSTIPTDGSTINVYVDGQFVGTPTYNQYRADIAGMFPGYNNSDGAGWYLDVDTQSYADGVHAVQWTVTDETSGGGAKALASAPTTMAQLFVVQNERPLPSDVDDSNKKAPEQFTVHPVYPNPFNPSSTITYQLDQPGQVELTVFDLQGRQVRTLLSGQSKDAGSHVMEWAGKNDSGNQVASGVYFLTLKSDSRIQTQKMVLIR